MGKASSRGYRVSLAMKSVATAAKQPPAGLPSIWECCSASSAQGSTGKCSQQYQRVCLEAERTTRGELLYSTSARSVSKHPHFFRGNISLSPLTGCNVISLVHQIINTFDSV